MQRMKLTNYEIYTYAQQLNSAFTNKNLYLPARVNFFLQKNTQLLLTLAQEIEESRLNIIRHYGIANIETGNIEIPADKVEIASNEIQELLMLEQEVNITKININKFGDIELSLEQMNAIMFMIEED